MAALGQNFDATQVAPSAPMETVPPGDYVVQIINSEMKSTKDNTGQFLWLEMDIIDGEFQGRKLWDRLNLVNNNAQAVEISQRALSAICHSTGVLNVQDSEQLHFKPMVASVKVKPPKGEYDASNEIKGYKPLNGAAPVLAVRTQTATVSTPKNSTASVSGGANTPPWKRK